LEIATDARLPAVNRPSGKLLRSFQKRSLIYVLGIFTYLLSFPVAEISGTRPDYEIVGEFAFDIFLTSAAAAICLLVWKLIHMIFVEKPTSPSRALVQWIAGFVTKDARVSGFFHMFAAVSFFVIGFAVLKGAVGVINPFEWDRMFLDWDRVLHFGYLPHELLWPLINNHFAMLVINSLYNVWFFVLMACFLTAGINSRPVHMQYLVSFMLTWLIGGFFLATIFSSAGPAFYERAGFGEDYLPLMSALKQAGGQTALWALSTQDVLWEGFVGERRGSAGISAFPSMHVATATLMALYARRVNRILGWVAWGFLAAIMLGSVVLAWHYAVDGYASIALAAVVWKIAGRFQHPKNISKPAR